MTPRPPDDVSTPIDVTGIPRSSGALPMPESIAAMLATEAPEAFDSSDHIFELMWGGLRAMAYIRSGRVRLRARNGRDLTPYFPELARIPQRVRGREAILDGEIIATDAEGHPSFDMLRGRLEAMSSDGSDPLADLPLQFKIRRIPGQLSFQASDILWLDGRPLHDRPLWQRKNRLHEVVMPSPDFAAVDFVDDEGIAFFDAVVERRLDGIVARQKNGLYLPGQRSKSWLQIHALRSSDVVIGGYTIGGSRRRGEPFSQLLVGGYTDGRLEYVGAVSGGLSDSEARSLIRRMEGLHAPRSPFSDTPDIARLTFWTAPELVCRVRFSEWSRDGHLRFPIFSALRPDLDPADCILD